MKKKCLLFSILLIFIVLPLFSQSENVKTSDRIVINMKKYDNDVGLFFEEKYVYSNSYYSSSPLLTTIYRTNTNRIFEKINSEYTIQYDALNNPISIEYYSPTKEKIKKVIFEYDEEIIASYPFPAIEIFEIINLYPENRLRLKTIIDLKNNKKTYQKPKYTNNYLVSFITQDEKGKITEKINYSYKNNLLDKTETLDNKDKIKSVTFYLYDNHYRPNTIKFIICSNDYEYISSYCFVDAYNDGLFIKEKHYKPSSPMKIIEFEPYSKKEPYLIVDYTYQKK